MKNLYIYCNAITISQVLVLLGASRWFDALRRFYVLRTLYSKVYYGLGLKFIKNLTIVDIHVSNARLLSFMLKICRITCPVEWWNKNNATSVQIKLCQTHINYLKHKLYHKWTLTPFKFDYLHYDAWLIDCSHFVDWGETGQISEYILSNFF